MIIGAAGRKIDASHYTPDMVEKEIKRNEDLIVAKTHTKQKQNERDVWEPVKCWNHNHNPSHANSKVRTHAEYYTQKSPTDHSCKEFLGLSLVDQQSPHLHHKHLSLLVQDHVDVLQDGLCRGVLDELPADKLRKRGFLLPYVLDNLLAHPRHQLLRHQILRHHLPVNIIREQLLLVRGDARHNGLGPALFILSDLSLTEPSGPQFLLTELGYGQLALLLRLTSIVLVIVKGQRVRPLRLNLDWGLLRGRACGDAISGRVGDCRGAWRALRLKQGRDPAGHARLAIGLLGHRLVCGRLCFISFPFLKTKKKKKKKRKKVLCVDT
eukprot:Colp12_sorted_trinity150504_noHs@593